MSLPSESAIASAMAQALLGKLPIPDALGALVLDAIFPSGGLPSYFAEVYQEIRKIVKEELIADDVAKIDGQIKGVQLWVQNTYSAMKDQWAPEKRITEIQRFVDDMYENAIGPLRQERYQEAGFPVFLIAASVHLSLMQELAYSDPAHQDNPQKSGYAAAIVKSATDYADYLDATWPKVKSARDAAITVQTSTEQHNSPVPTVFITIYNFWCRDDVANYTSQTWSTPSVTNTSQDDINAARAPAQADRDARSTKALADLTEYLGNPDEISRNWRALASFPIPMPGPCEAKIDYFRLVNVSRAPFPGGVDVTDRLEWGTEKAVAVYLDDQPVGASGAQYYHSRFSERGNDSGSTPPLTLKVVDQYRREASQNYS